MKVFSTLWGLLVDDGRLSWILLVALIMAAIASLLAHLASAGAVLIWLGLIVSLIISVEHQLRIRTKP